MEYPSVYERLFKDGRGEENNVKEYKIGNMVYRVKSVFEGSRNIDNVLLRLAIRNADRDKNI
ncbi:MAG TPA: hypothetical protein DEQ65_06735 [Ruminococcaceae bacterium]|nr:hypothetical protein [Oscillospiraceae bacterium]